MFDIFKVSWPELKLRAEFAWWQVVAARVQHRPCFDSLHRVDVLATREWMALQTPQDAATMRKLLNGAHCTADAAVHWNDGESGQCAWCDSEDSRYHRFWVCEMFASQRQAALKTVGHVLASLPAAVSCCGWALRPSTWLPWMTSLASLKPSSVGDLQLLQTGADGWADVFSDGCCWHPMDRYKRLASWALIQATADVSGGGATLLGQGVLAGLLQSAYRAELTASVLALELAVVSRCCLRLWSDSLGVVNGLITMQRTRRCKGVNTSHFDLWHRAYVALQTMDFVGKFTHVTSHMEELQDSELASWASVHNRCVDRAAARANLQRPDWFLQQYRDHCLQVDVTRQLSVAVQTTLLHISRDVFRSSVPREDPGDDAAEPEYVPPDGGPLDVSLLPGVSCALVCKWGTPYISLLNSWLHSVLDGPRLHAEPCWISMYQLFLDWVLSTGHCGVLYVQGRWQTSGHHSEQLAGFPFKQRSKWWARSFTEFMADRGHELIKCFTRPVSDVLMLHCGCVWWRWDPDRLFEVDRWLGTHLTSTATRGGHSLQSLNPCTRGHLPQPAELGLIIR
eukprot:Skav236761  [mRNA]  locus=scaffold3662:73624:75324:+ [translate_table: standard]